MKSKSIFLKSILFSFAILVPSLFAGTVVDQAVAPNLHTYVIVSLPSAYQGQAESDLVSLFDSNFHLATITSQEEQDFVAGLLDANGQGGQFWIGGVQDPITTPGAADNWSWVTGEAWSYTNWDPTEPNDFNGPGTEQYLTMWDSYGWGWNDEGGNYVVGGYIAESSTATIQIDIKSGGDDNCINLGSNGVVPVAILGSAGFDVHDVNQSTVVFEGASPKAKGKSGNLGSFEDVNSDGFTDLVMHFPTQELGLVESDTEGELTGMLYAYTMIVGTDAVCIVPPSLEKNGIGQMAPLDYQLAPNTPNPFNPSTRISYTIPEEANVTLDVYNVRGERVATLVNAIQTQGVHTVHWNGTNDFGQAVPGGLYIARMSAGSFAQTIRMVLLK